MLFEEGNMANISPTIKIDISIKPGIIEEITIGAACHSSRTHILHSSLPGVPGHFFLVIHRNAQP
jgi:hypothetical protein